MIKTEHLSKSYGQLTAVNDVSININTGEVTGLLGPNGAGKTTILKMLTGRLYSSSGQIYVGDMEIESNLNAAKKLVGYLPEHNPLYDEMTASEYLFLMARLHGMPEENIVEGIKTAVKKCGLTNVLDRPINQLSKGYRQRIGIASAIAHNPQIIILDEPTSGLDPNQTAEIHDLINELKKDRTILLSTHILSEAQKICSHIIIINKGNIVLDNKIDELASGKFKTVFIADKPNCLNLFKKELKKKHSNITVAAVIEGEGEHYEVYSNDDVRRDIFDIAKENDIPLIELKKETDDLASVFRRLTND